MFSQYQKPKPQEEETGSRETMRHSSNRKLPQQQQQQQPEHKDKATELIDAFAVTVQSLADDSTTLCQMSSLIDHVMPATGTGEVDAGRGSAAATTKKQNTLSDLQGLEEWVTGLEEKVVALQELIKEEQQAMDTIVEGKLMEEAERQASVVAHQMTLVKKKTPPSTGSANNGVPRTPQPLLSHHKQNGEEVYHQQQQRSAASERTMKQPSSATNTPARSTRALMPKSVNLPAARTFTSTPHRSSRTRKQETSFNSSYDDGDDDYNDESELVYHDGETIDAADHSLYLDKNDDEEEDRDGEEEFPAAFVFVLPRVSRQELNDKLSSLRIGRLSLIDVNEALEEIEEICRQKQQESFKFFFHQHHNTASRSSSSSNHSNNHGGGNSSYYLSNAALQRKYEYLMRQRNMTYDHSNVGGTGAAGTTGIDTEALQSLHEGKTCWVTEQELREHCAFFRHGESTARATLTLLCSLRRLKQVPGRNRTTVTYICLSSPSSSSSISTTVNSTPCKYTH